jgi:Type VIII secretion system (T8SS), CsgF protein
MKKLLLASFLTYVSTGIVIGAPINDFSFKSPAFNGIGYSSHVLTIENQEHTRVKERADAIQAAIDKAAADAKNTNIAKFMNNLESRIYAQFSQNLATAMFANGNCTTASDPCQGSFVMEKDVNGKTLTSIAWQKNGSNIEMTVTQNGLPTTITIPLAQFQIPGL